MTTDNERKNLLMSIHGIQFLISSKGSFMCTIPQTGYHIQLPLLHQLGITGVLGPPGGINVMVHCIMSGHSTMDSKTWSYTRLFIATQNGPSWEFACYLIKAFNFFQIFKTSLYLYIWTCNCNCEYLDNGLEANPVVSTEMVTVTEYHDNGLEANPVVSTEMVTVTVNTLTMVWKLTQLFLQRW